MHKSRFHSALAVRLCAGGLAVALLAPGIVYGWGSTTSLKGSKYEVSATHQFIESAAYAGVSKDTAFREGLLPTLEEMAAYAGNDIVETKVLTVSTNWEVVSRAEFTAVGIGPDADNMSNYGEHWYNPAIGKGDGPTAVSSHILAWLRSGRKDVKAVDWAAHYLADMSTPVHVFGTSKKDILEQVSQALVGAGRSVTQSLKGLTLHLDPLITGAGSEGRNWAREVEIFRLRATNPHVDYFDPWYYDQVETVGAYSSGSFLGKDFEGFEGYPVYRHGKWEANVRPVNGWDGRYSPIWQNSPKPSFAAYQKDLGDRVLDFATKAAKQTRGAFTDLDSYDTAAAINRAIANVATLWRASFSGLDPSIKKLDMILDNGIPKVNVTFSIKNWAKETPTDVQARVAVLDSKHVYRAGEDNVFIGSDVAPVKEEVVALETELTWELDVPANARGDNLVVQVEVIGQYPNTTPDLQYAYLRKSLKPVESSVIFLMDGSGSMAGKKIESTKTTARAQIFLMKEDVEVAVILFSNCGNIQVIAPFLILTPENKNKMQALIGALTSDGGTPLGEAVAFAHDYMDNNASGKTQTVILLSDGEETCKGDPVAEAGRLNP